MNNRRRRLRKTLLGAGIGLAILVPAALLALWLAFQRIPGWYQPPVLDQAGIQRAQADAAAVENFVSERMVSGEPFDLILHDQSVNEWLAALPYSLPDVWRQMPEEFSRPAVRFDDDEIRLGAHFSRHGLKAILSVTVNAGVSRDGGQMMVRLGSVEGGSLPAPRKLLEEFLEPLLTQARFADRPNQPALVPIVAALKKAENVDDLFEGVAIPNRFLWPNGRRYFRITSIDSRGGELRLHIEPI